MRSLVYLVPVALVVAIGFLVWRLSRSWKATGSRWGGGAPGLPTVTLSEADLDEDVRQARELDAEREGRGA